MTLATIDRYDASRLGRVGDRAVVVGGSMAGLCAARVLADGFSDVVVLERDPLPDDPAPRDGAPQTNHPHVLLEGGRATLEDLFPGFSEDVLSAGGLLVDTSTELQEYNRGGFLADPGTRLATYCATRPLFEAVVRRHLRTIENVTIRENHQFLTYVPTETGTAVGGVRFRDEAGTEESVEADLVVDATGRTSRTPEWLRANGYEAPPTDTVQIDVTYSTVRIERPPDDRRMVLVGPDAPRTRGGALIPVEDDRWEVILQGVHGDEPPADPDGLQSFAESLPVSGIADRLATQDWCSATIQQYPYPASRRHRYDDLQSFPDGLVVLGDALASFNPIYGQGMSVAALETVLLHHALADGGLDRLGPRFFERATALVDIVWQVVVGGDFEFPQTTGPKPTGTRLANWYVDRLIRQAHTDPVVSEAFARVTRLEQPPGTLVRPRILRRVLPPSGLGTPLESLAEWTTAHSTPSH